MVRNLRKAQVTVLLTEKLDSLSQRLFSPSDLTQLFTQLRADRGLPKSLTANQFRDLALENKVLKEVKLNSTYPLRTIRYHNGHFTAYELALSLRPRSYLCHGTAALLHGLTDSHPEYVYVNQEQSAKEQFGSLTQAALNRAFSGRQRQSGFIVTHDTAKIMLLSGKETSELAVNESKGPDGELVRLTNLERTLVDIAVRPGYAGGTTNVLRCYNQAIQKISVEDLVEILEELDYLYPYHQAIGFLLQRSGHRPDSLAKLRKHRIKYDFFLAHGMKETRLDPLWRIYYPADLPDYSETVRVPP